MFNKILLKGIDIYLEDQHIKNGYIKIIDEKIVEIDVLTKLENDEDFQTVQVPSTFKAIPGFIDVHIHGVNGADVMDGTKEALDIMSSSLPKEGTTSFLATTMTQDIKEIEKALVNIGHYLQEKQTAGKAEIVGVHLEGPFVNAVKAGAQPLKHIIDPDLTLLKKWELLTNNMIKLVTLAPERPGGLDMIHYLSTHGIVASIGHSDATFEEVNKAIDSGANHVTHLYNQMSGLHHREPGVVGSVFLRDELKAEIIVDGVHVCPEMVELAYKIKRKDGLILITDSMRAKCLKNGEYDLGGQEVIVKDGKAVLADGTLAGSILKLGTALQNIMAYTGCTLADAIEMASVNPAKQLNIFDRKGSLAIGKDADIVILDENLDVYMTFCRGKLAFTKGGQPV